MSPMGRDQYLSKIEAFFEMKKIPVLIRKFHSGYSIYMAKDNTPVARIKLGGMNDSVELVWWNERKRWDSPTEEKGICMSFEKALKSVADEIEYLA